MSDYKMELSIAIREAEKTAKDECRFLDRDDEDYIAYKVKAARSEVVKKIVRNWQNAIDYALEHYKPELNFKKGDKYPKNWMNKNPKIMKTFEEYKYLLPILNYLFRLSRYQKGEIYEQLKELAGDIRYEHPSSKKTYEHAMFMLTGRLYEKMAKKIECSKSIIEKYIKTLKKGEILKFVCKNGRKEIWSDGFYLTGKYTRKETFVTIDHTEIFERFNLAGKDLKKPEEPKEIPFDEIDDEHAKLLASLAKKDSGY